MNLMLKKFYEKVHTKQRNSIIGLEEYIPFKLKAKRAQSQSNYNNLTKTSEKSVRMLAKITKKRNEGASATQRQKSNPKTKTIKHKAKCSIVPKGLSNKSKVSKRKVSAKARPRFDSNVSLSESYDSLLQQFNCGDELKSSLKQLVKLEKLSMKQKLSFRHKSNAKKVFLNSFHNSWVKK